MTALTADRVEEIFRDCLLREGEHGVPADGVLHPVLLHAGRIAEHDTEIAAMLAELPPQFQADDGGGWSFLNACDDRHGEQWTGFHLVMEHLFQLGEAAGRVKSLMPRELWDALPGGMPYYVVLAEPVVTR